MPKLQDLLYTNKIPVNTSKNISSKKERWILIDHALNGLKLFIYKEVQTSESELQQICQFNNKLKSTINNLFE